MKIDAAIILVGVKHSGKTTLGKNLADKLGIPFIDVDFVMTQITGISPRDLYLMKGAVAFMQTEYMACQAIQKKYNGVPVVIATGGGICDNPQAMILLTTLGRFVMINSPVKLVCDRVFSKVSQLPDGTWQGLPAYVADKNPKDEVQAREIFTKIITERIENYKQIADRVFVPTKDSIEVNVNKLQEIL